MEQLRTLVEKAITENSEIAGAEQVLQTAKDELADIQNQVAVKQEAVKVAADTVSKERGETVAALQAVVARANELLTGLQS